MSGALSPTGARGGADDPAALNAAGLAALGRREFGTAVALLRRAVAADRASALLWYNLATALSAAGDVAAEAEALDNALDRDPYLGHALLARGRLREVAGDAREALALYQRLIAATDPREPVGPGFAAGLAHARGLVEAATAALAARLDVALAPALADTGEATMRFRHFIDASLGRRRLYTHQPLVLHYPYLPAEQFLSRRHFPWLAELEAATPVIRAEVKALLADDGDGFAPYVAYPAGSPVNQWVELNHNDAWGARFLIEHGNPCGAVRARCPETAALIDRFPLFDCPGRGPVAFFSRLKPRTRIPAHSGATNIRSIIHLPLIVPDDCGFRVGNETRAWETGRAFVFDDTIEHEAWNNSDRDRVILILDVWNPHIALAERDLIRDYIAALETGDQALGSFE